MSFLDEFDNTNQVDMNDNSLIQPYSIANDPTDNFENKLSKNQHQLSKKPKSKALNSLLATQKMSKNTNTISNSNQKLTNANHPSKNNNNNNNKTFEDEYDLSINTPSTPKSYRIVNKSALLYNEEQIEERLSGLYENQLHKVLDKSNYRRIQDQKSLKTEKLKSRSNTPDKATIEQEYGPHKNSRIHISKSPINKSFSITTNNNNNSASIIDSSSNINPTKTQHNRALSNNNPDIYANDNAKVSSVINQNKIGKETNNQQSKSYFNNKSNDNANHETIKKDLNEKFSKNENHELLNTTVNNSNNKEDKFSLNLSKTTWNKLNISMENKKTGKDVSDYSEKKQADESILQKANQIAEPELRIEYVKIPANNEESFLNEEGSLLINREVILETEKTKLTKTRKIVDEVGNSSSQNNNKKQNDKPKKEDLRIKYKKYVDEYFNTFMKKPEIDEKLSKSTINIKPTPDTIDISPRDLTSNTVENKKDKLTVTTKQSIKKDEPVLYIYPDQTLPSTSFFGQGKTDNQLGNKKPNNVSNEKPKMASVPKNEIISGVYLAKPIKKTPTDQIEAKQVSSQEYLQLEFNKTKDIKDSQDVMNSQNNKKNQNIETTSTKNPSQKPLNKTEALVSNFKRNFNAIKDKKVINEFLDNSQGKSKNPNMSFADESKLLLKNEDPKDLINELFADSENLTQMNPVINSITTSYLNNNKAKNRKNPPPSNIQEIKSKVNVEENNETEHTKQMKEYCELLIEEDPREKQTRSEKLLKAEKDKLEIVRKETIEAQEKSKDLALQAAKEREKSNKLYEEAETEKKKTQVLLKKAEEEYAKFLTLQKLAEKDKDEAVEIQREAEKAKNQSEIYKKEAEKEKEKYENMIKKAENDIENFKRLTEEAETQKNKSLNLMTKVEKDEQKYAKLFEEIENQKSQMNELARQQELEKSKLAENNSKQLEELQKSREEYEKLKKMLADHQKEKSYLYALIAENEKKKGEIEQKNINEELNSNIKEKQYKELLDKVEAEEGKLGEFLKQNEIYIQETKKKEAVLGSSMENSLPEVVLKAQNGGTVSGSSTYLSTQDAKISSMSSSSGVKFNNNAIEEIGRASNKEEKNSNMINKAQQEAEETESKKKISESRIAINPPVIMGNTNTITTIVADNKNYNASSILDDYSPNKLRGLAIKLNTIKTEHICYYSMKPTESKNSGLISGNEISSMDQEALDMFLTLKKNLQYADQLKTFISLICNTPNKVDDLLYLLNNPSSSFVITLSQLQELQAESQRLHYLMQNMQEYENNGYPSNNNENKSATLQNNDNSIPKSNINKNSDLYPINQGIPNSNTILSPPSLPGFSQNNSTGLPPPPVITGISSSSSPIISGVSNNKPLVPPIIPGISGNTSGLPSNLSAPTSSGTSNNSQILIPPTIPVASNTNKILVPPSLPSITSNTNSVPPNITGIQTNPPNLLPSSLPGIPSNGPSLPPPHLPGISSGGPSLPPPKLPEITKSPMLPPPIIPGISSGSSSLPPPNLLIVSSGGPILPPPIIPGISSGNPSLSQPNLPEITKGPILPPPIIPGISGGNPNLPPPNIPTISNSGPILPPPIIPGLSSGNLSLPPPIIPGISSNGPSLPPPNLLGITKGPSLPPPNLPNISSGNPSLPPPNLQGITTNPSLPLTTIPSISIGNSSLPPPNLPGISSGNPSLPPPNLPGITKGPSLPPPMIPGISNGNPSLPPPIIPGISSGNPSLPPPMIPGISNGNPSLPPPMIPGISSGGPSLPPPNLLGMSKGPGLPPPMIPGISSGGPSLPPPMIPGISSGGPSLPPPNLSGMNKGPGLPPPMIPGISSGGPSLPPPMIPGISSGVPSLPPPNLSGMNKGPGLPPPMIPGISSGGPSLPPPMIPGISSGGPSLPPPNLSGMNKGPGLPPPMIPGISNGGPSLPPPMIPGISSGGPSLPPPNLSGMNKGPGLPPPMIPGISSGGPSLPPPNLSGMSKGPGLPPPMIPGISSGGPSLPPPNLPGVSKGPGLPPPMLPGISSGGSGLPPPNLPGLGKGPGLPPPGLPGLPMPGGGGLGLPPPFSKGPGLPAPGLPGLPTSGLPGLPGLGAPKLGAPGGLPTIGGKMGGPPGLPGLPMTGQPQQPRKNFKPVFWETVPAVKFQGTIWSMPSMQAAIEIKFDDIEEMFLNISSQKGGVVGSANTENLDKKKIELMCILPDSKRAYNMNIMLSKFKKFAMNDLKNAILLMDPNIITPESAQTLLPFCPDSEEIKIAATFDGDLDYLDAASQFVFHVHKIPRLQVRLRTLLFKEEFKKKLESSLGEAETVEKACTTLKNSTNFQKFLKIALSLGNLLNQGTARGSACGFKLASLMAFMNTKGNKPGITVLTYMLGNILQQNPDILDFTKEFDLVLTDASKINIESIHSLQNFFDSFKIIRLDPVKDLISLKAQVNAIKPQLDQAEKSIPPDTGFLQAFKVFYEEAVPEALAAEDRATKIKNYYIDIAKFLGEDDESLKKKSSEDFFGILKNLTDLIKAFIKADEDKKKAEARKAAMAKNMKK